jgi:uncharacterized cupredoxin-like copper-binding protein
VTVRHARVVAGICLLLAGVTGASAAIAASGGEPTPRTVEVTMRLSRFEPPTIEVRPGETVRFVIRNEDPIDHEFIIGDRTVQRIHEQGTEAHHPPRPGELSVPAGRTRETRFTFPPASGSLILGCHVPAHYAYGMRADIRIG